MKSKSRFNKIRVILDEFLNILFPEPCPVCGEQDNAAAIFPICRVCWNSLESYRGPICQLCGKFLVSSEALTCSECLLDVPYFEYARSFGRYDGAMKEAVHQLKYYGRRNLARPLAELLRKLPFEKNDVIVPVPIHYNRLKVRQFNQSCLLAKELSFLIGIPFTVDSLIKIKDTRPQVELGKKERKINVRNAFAVKDKGSIVGKRVLLIDDVITTSATVRECSKELIRGGAKTVKVISLVHG